MRTVSYSSMVKKDKARMVRRGKNIEKLIKAVFYLKENGTLPVQYDAHKLHGEYAGRWECHLESDWLLLYSLTPETVFVARTGTHTDLFE